MKTIKAALIFFAVFLPSLLWAKNSPIPMLESTANQIINTLEKNRDQLKKNHKVIYQAVEKHLLPIVDVRGMSRSVLGRNAWKKATAAQKRDFTREFTRLVIRTYASPLAEYSDERVKFLPLRGNADGRFVRVNSVIMRSNGQNIPLSYSMVSKKGEWKIFDLSVEGVSLLQSFRTQFSQILRNADMDALIKQMRKEKVA